MLFGEILIIQTLLLMTKRIKYLEEKEKEVTTTIKEKKSQKVKKDKKSRKGSKLFFV